MKPRKLLPETRIAIPLCEISFNKGRIVGANQMLSDYDEWLKSKGCLEEAVKAGCLVWESKFPEVDYKDVVNLAKAILSALTKE